MLALTLVGNPASAKIARSRRIRAVEAPPGSCKFGLPPGRVAEEEHIWTIFHFKQGGKRARDLVAADGHQREVVTVVW